MAGLQQSWFSALTNGRTAQPQLPYQRQMVPVQPPRRPWPGILGWLRSWVGGWAGPRFAQDTPAAEELTRERVNTGPMGIIVPWFEPYLDVTGETQEMRRAYRRMLANGYVKSALMSNIWGVASLDLQVHPADKTNPKDKLVAEFVEHNLTERVKGCLAGLVESILLGALVDGYSISEKVWACEDRGKWAGKYILRQLKPKLTHEDCVLEIDQYRNVVSVLGLQYNSGQHFHPGHFCIYQHMPIYGHPTGMSALRSAYGAWWRLDTAEKLRAVALGTRSVPPVIGTYQNPAVQADLNKMLASLRERAWATVPEGVLVETLNLAGASEEIFSSAVRDYKHDIYIAICGAILQALEGTVTDGAGNSQVHKSTSELIRWYLSRAVESLLNDHENGLITDMVDLNFVVNDYPKATLSSVDLTEMAAELNIAQRLQGMGVDLSLEELRERCGWKAPTTPEDRLPGRGLAVSPGFGPDGKPPPGTQPKEPHNPLVTARPFDECSGSRGDNPFQQERSYSCGAAALRWACYYLGGGDPGEERCRAVCGTTTDGTSPEQLADGCTFLKLQARPGHIVVSLVEDALISGLTRRHGLPRWVEIDGVIYQRQHGTQAAYLRDRSDRLPAIEEPAGK